MGPALYKRVLVFFDDGVLPHIQKPMAWLDFLCDAYEQPGVLPILALASMYTLITVHNVEYPDFYSKLYSVLSLESMYTVHRVEFSPRSTGSCRRPTCPTTLLRRLSSVWRGLRSTGRPRAR